MSLKIEGICRSLQSPWLHVDNVIRNERGDILAAEVRGRTYPLCRVCRVVFRDLKRHHSTTECGKFDKAGMWWTPDRPVLPSSKPEPEQMELIR